MGLVFSALRRLLPEFCHPRLSIDVKALRRNKEDQNIVLYRLLELCRVCQNGPVADPPPACLPNRNGNPVNPAFPVTMAAGLRELEFLQGQLWLLLSIRDGEKMKSRNASSASKLGTALAPKRDRAAGSEKLQLAEQGSTNLQMHEEVQQQPRNVAGEYAQVDLEKKVIATESGTAPTHSREAEFLKTAEELESAQQWIRNLRRELRDLQQQSVNATEEHQRKARDAKAHFETLLIAVKQEHGEVRGQDMARIAFLEERCQSFQAEANLLQGQISQLEAQASRQTSAGGSYLDSAGTPSDVQLLADKLKQTLASFTKALMYGKGNVPKDEAREVANAFLSGAELARRSDVKFCYQSMVASTVFYGFEAEDFHVEECLSSELDWEKKRAENYRQYKELSVNQDENVVGNLAIAMDNVRSDRVASCHIPGSLNGCPTSCSEGSSCVCGRERFLMFCCRKVEELMWSELGDFWTERTQDGMEDMKLSEQLLPLLNCVWLSHLLVHSFQQPGVLLKMKRGLKFDPEYMEKVVVQDEELSDRDESVLRVAFIVVPGFRIGRSIVRGQVYIQHQFQH